MYLATSPEANTLLEHDPLALLVGMLLDQQIPMEKAFTSPHVLAERLGMQRLDAETIANYEPEALEHIFRAQPALHRFPAAMAKRVQELAKVVVERFDGDAASVWANAATGQELVERLADLPGFGGQKAKIFTALLGKQFNVRPAGWREAAGDYGLDGSTRSIADVVDAASRQAVRAHKQAAKATAKAAAMK